MHFTIIDETVLPLSSFCQILVETSDKNDFKKSVQKYIPCWEEDKNTIRLNGKLSQVFEEMMNDRVLCCAC